MRTVKLLGILSLLIAVAITSSCQRNNELIVQNSKGKSSKLAAKADFLDTAIAYLGVTSVTKDSSSCYSIVTSSAGRAKLNVCVLQGYVDCKKVSVKNALEDSVFVFSLCKGGDLTGYAFKYGSNLDISYASRSVILKSDNIGFASDVRDLRNIQFYGMLVDLLDEKGYNLNPVTPPTSGYETIGNGKSQEQAEADADKRAVNMCFPDTPLPLRYQTVWSSDGRVVTTLYFGCSDK